jgi:hypothetical protein
MITHHSTWHSVSLITHHSCPTLWWIYALNQTWFPNNETAVARDSIYTLNRIMFPETRQKKNNLGDWKILYVRVLEKPVEIFFFRLLSSFSCFLHTFFSSTPFSVKTANQDKSLAFRWHWFEHTTATCVTRWKWPQSIHRVRKHTCIGYRPSPIYINH